jgi:hypothetical protein
VIKGEEAVAEFDAQEKHDPEFIAVQRLANRHSIDWLEYFAAKAKKAFEETAKDDWRCESVQLVFCELQAWLISSQVAMDRGKMKQARKWYRKLVEGELDYELLELHTDEWLMKLFYARR